MIAFANEREISIFNGALNSSVSRVDQGLEDWIEQSSNLLALLRRSNRNEGSLELMRLEQNESAIAPQVSPGSLEGMDHALDRDSSKRPAEKRDVKWVAR